MLTFYLYENYVFKFKKIDLWGSSLWEWLIIPVFQMSLLRLREVQHLSPWAKVKRGLDLRLAWPQCPRSFSNTTFVCTVLFWALYKLFHLILTTQQTTCCYLHLRTRVGKEVTPCHSTLWWLAASLLESNRPEFQLWFTASLAKWP